MSSTGAERLLLHSCPHACSLVSHIALELAEADFTVNFVDLWKGGQRSLEYLKVNPRGKVPALATSQGVITENIAILIWLAERFPQARLLPDRSSSPFVQAVSDLAWFSSGIHPLISRIVVPERFATEGPCSQSVRAIAAAGLDTEFARIDKLLSDREWWLGRPSAPDAYLFWFWARAQEVGYEVARFKRFEALIGRMLALPAVFRALQRERAFMPCYKDLT